MASSSSASSASSSVSGSSSGPNAVTPTAPKGSGGHGIDCGTFVGRNGKTYRVTVELIDKNGKPIVSTNPTQVALLAQRVKKSTQDMFNQQNHGVKLIPKKGSTLVIEKKLNENSNVSFDGRPYGLGKEQLQYVNNKMDDIIQAEFHAGAIDSGSVSVSAHRSDGAAAGRRAAAAAAATADEGGAVPTSGPLTGKDGPNDD